jgi:hypothetical protein
MRQQIIVLLVPFDDGNPDGVPESWEWDGVGELVLAGRVEDAGTPVIINGGGDAVWTVPS